MKYHFYLVSGTVIFIDTNGDEPSGGVTELNAMLRLEKPQVNQSALQEAQARLCNHLMQEVQKAGANPQQISVQRIVLGTINYLGEMLDEEFYTIQPANDTEASADETPADPALELARMGREDATLN